MSNTLTIRVSKDLADWLQRKSLRTGMSQGQIVREQLERGRRGDGETKKFMRFAGVIKDGPAICRPERATPDHESHCRYWIPSRFGS
jgi:hypothetical protein